MPNIQAQEIRLTFINVHERFNLPDISHSPSIITAVIRHFKFTLSAAVLLLGTLGAHAQNREILGEYRIGIVGRDQGDATYQATHLGAQNAARELSEQYSIDVELLVFTPNVEQGGSQQAALAGLFIEDADGFIISPAEPEALRPSIEFALEQGQEVVFFENQIKDIEPLAAYIADEVEAGRLAAQSLLKKLPTKGRVAILVSDNLDSGMQDRLAGAREALGYRRIEKVVQCAPDYQSAIEAIRATQEADRNDLIKGWLFLGDWPLLGMPALPWEPGQFPCVAIQSSPSAFMYIDQGYVDALIVHPYYEWGQSSMTALVNKLHKQESPKEQIQRNAPRVVDWRNIETYRESWKIWLK
ncbi:MAG: ribose transport system substrate-binding protein [Lentimonas sp.]|jgi:ribose transport system substrate-binding protein